MKSMTGYGRASYSKEGREYTIEIRSVNHRYSDVTIKLPRNLSYLEDIIRKQLLASISRGKVDVFVTFDNFSAEGKRIALNRELAKAYVEELKSLAEETGIESNIEVMEVSKLPDVFKLQLVDEDEDIIKDEVLECLAEAIKNFDNMKKVEGSKIKEDFAKRIDFVEEKVNKILTLSTGLIDEYVVKLRKTIQEILKTDVVDEARIAQEIVIYSDKCSIDEELTRLDSHIKQFRSLINLEDESIGKKLDFLIQEMNRETNTIGSKSVKLEITNLVIDIKTELENIREQIQNVE